MLVCASLSQKKKCCGYERNLWLTPLCFCLGEVFCRLIPDTGAQIQNKFLPPSSGSCSVGLGLYYHCLVWAPGCLLPQGISAFPAHPSANSPFSEPKQYCPGARFAGDSTPITYSSCHVAVHGCLRQVQARSYNFGSTGDVSLS